MFCPHCGHQLRDGVRFCENCGAATQQSVVQFLPYHDEPTPCNTPVAATPEVPAKPQEVAPPVHKKKSKLLPILAITVVLIAAVAALFLLTGKQTVYLTSKTVQKTPIGNDFLTTTTTYKYDEDGRILNYKHKIDYPDAYDIASSTLKISYTYDDEGQLESANWDLGEESFEVEYIYEDGVWVDLEIEHSDANEYDFEFDGNGHIESVDLTSSSLCYTKEFEYHENGVLKESLSKFTLPIQRETRTRYDEFGRIIETESSFGGEAESRQVQSYDKNGNLILIEIYSPNEEGKLVLNTSIEFKPVYNKKQLSELSMVLNIPDEDDNLQEAVLEFECTWEDQECTMKCVDIAADKDMLEQLEDSGNDLEDLEIFFARDKAGNLIKFEISLDNRILQDTKTEFQAFEIPRNNTKPHYVLDPMYLFQIFGS